MKECKQRCCSLSSCIIIIFLIWVLWTFRNIHYFRIVPHKLRPAADSQFLILYYTRPSWFGNDASKMNSLEDCEYQNCTVVFDHTLLTKSDVVIFYQVGMQDAPAKNREQIWVFSTLEAPYTTSKAFNNPGFKDNFNWTMTYRYDSEAVVPYGLIVERTRIPEKNYTSIFLNKTKEVAWVVSNCKTVSKREQYVKELSKYINVDIYGRCGTPCKHQSAEECKKMLSENYKFYLSFENSLCHDYMTEKILTIYMDDINFIPIVRGAPNIDKRLPKNTFISSLDYKSPKELAEFLKKVGSNETHYTSFLKKKDKYNYKQNYLFQTGICDICRRLNLGLNSKSKVDLDKWLWDKQCLDPNDF